MDAKYRDYMLGQLEKLLTIPAVTGYSAPVQTYLAETVRGLGYEPALLRKGGVTAKLGGEGDALTIAAHADDIGLMVRQIKPNGRLSVTNIGGLHAPYADQENVTVLTRSGGRVTGVIRLVEASNHIHTHEHCWEPRDFAKNTELVLDSDAACPDDVRALGVRVGDLVALEPRYVRTGNGFLKSRFLDDKACVAVLLAYMKFLADEGRTPRRAVCAYFSMFEEIGHGGTVLPPETEELLALDIGPVGDVTGCDEHKVFLCAKDAAFPYHYDTLTRLIETAEANAIPHTVDVLMPSYGSDADCALRAGYDIRWGLIGPGVYATHGYEHTHIDALEATFDLIAAYTL